MNNDYMRLAFWKDGMHRISYFEFFAIIFILTIITLLLIYGKIIFGAPLFEHGDLAANSLSIMRARDFSEIYGNYSRWHFNHPGPYFWYVYAFGEIMFFDIMHIVPAQLNAYALTILLHQTLFFTIGVTLLYSLNKNALFSMIIWVFLLIHFLAAGQSFISVWPPHQFLMPFFVMMISGVVVAEGKIAILPLFILSCSVCVHAHVAQPLFVLPAFVFVVFAVYSRFVQKSSKTLWSFLRENRNSMIISLGIITLFVTPIILDITLYDSYNLGRIIEHSNNPSEVADNTLWASIKYNLMFLRYWGFHDVVEKGTSFGAGLGTYQFIFLLIGISAIGSCVLWKIKGKNSLSGLSGGVINGFIIVILFVLLSVIWAKMQNGPLYAFNSFFVYAIIGVTLYFTLFLSLILKPFFVYTKAFYIVFVGLLAVKAYGSISNGWIIVQKENERTLFMKDKQFRRDIETRLSPSSEIFLDSDGSAWAELAELTLFLKRLGFEVSYPKKWDFLLGKQDQERKLRLNSKIFISTKEDFKRELLKKEKNLYIYLNEEGRFNVMDEIMPDEFHKIGFLGENNKVFEWSIGDRLALGWKSEYSEDDVRIIFDVFPFTADGKIKQRIFIELGDIVHEEVMDKEKAIILDVRKELWNKFVLENGGPRIIFRFPDACSPSSYLMSDDSRKLALAFRKIVIQEENILNR